MKDHAFLSLFPIQKYSFVTQFLLVARDNKYTVKLLIAGGGIGYPSIIIVE